MLIEWHESATDEVNSASRWYAGQNPDLAEDFLAEVERAVDDIVAMPQTFAKSRYGTQFYLCRRFPYVIHYHLRNGTLHIVAVVHTSRRPGYWIDRLN